MTHNAWHGQQVTLRDVEPGDWEAYSALYEDTESMRFGWQIHFPRSAEAMKAWAEETAKNKPEGDDHVWTIAGPDGTWAGTINTHLCDSRDGTFEYGISIDRLYWGRGYAADAMKVVFRYMFDELGYAKVQGRVYDYNDRSLRMHESFGMVREGCLRSAHFTDGKRHDVILCGMTAAEFRTRHPRPPNGGRA